MEEATVVENVFVPQFVHFIKKSSNTNGNTDNSSSSSKLNGRSYYLSIQLLLQHAEQMVHKTLRNNVEKKSNERSERTPVYPFQQELTQSSTQNIAAFIPTKCNICNMSTNSGSVDEQMKQFWEHQQNKIDDIDSSDFHRFSRCFGTTIHF